MAEEDDSDDRDDSPAKTLKKDKKSTSKNKRKQAKTEAKDAPENAPAKLDAKPWVGVGGKASGDSMIVSSVTPDSPAYKAGIQTDDELIAVNDFRLDGRISGRLEQFEVGEPLEVLLSRRGALLRIEVTPEAKTKFNWSLSFVKEPSKRQERSQESWLGDN